LDGFLTAADTAHIQARSPQQFLAQVNDVRVIVYDPDFWRSHSIPLRERHRLWPRIRYSPFVIRYSPFSLLL